MTLLTASTAECAESPTSVKVCVRSPTTSLASATTAFSASVVQSTRCTERRYASRTDTSAAVCNASPARRRHRVAAGFACVEDGAQAQHPLPDARLDRPERYVEPRRDGAVRQAFPVGDLERRSLLRRQACER